MRYGERRGHPTAEWIANQITEAFGWERAPHYLIRDRDQAYGNVFIRRLRSMGIRDRPTSPRSPWQNGYAERLISSIRRECLDHLVPLPSRAQFLNVIESVFSGMSRAIIHNSNFENSSQASDSIDPYFLNQNEFYKIHPKRAGRKIWQHETCGAVFKEDNNCKDPSN